MNVASHDGPKDPIRLGTCEFRSRNAITAFTPWPLFSEVTRYDELSQINGIYPEHCEAFFDAGISTVAQLAATSPERIGELIGWTPRAAGRYAHLARSRHLNVPLAMASLICPPPPRFIFDIETDPYGGNKLCWCIGVLDEATGDFVQFVATSEEEESRMLGEFLEWCTTARPGGLVAYSGSDFDKRNLICRLQAHGLSIPKILEESVDLLEPVRKALAVPIPSYQLKALAELLGFSFRHSDLEGFEVGSLALRAIRSRRRIPRKLLEYNEDDVRSTAHIIAEVERICGFAHAASRTRRTTRTARQGAGRMAKA
ncbi:MAG TPA: TM0106 family RecB-like putative nuclease [Gemmatimonadaceae bacterium]|nr:TM0106 family RecB-like putative nuclease [Gemmatimonadaceae bacterium]